MPKSEKNCIAPDCTPTSDRVLSRRLMLLRDSESRIPRGMGDRSQTANDPSADLFRVT